MKKNHDKSIYYEGHYYCSKGNGYYYNSHLRKHLHQMVWITERGPIPNGYEIHHVDFNRENNDISNLVCIPKEEHHKIHSDALTDEQREWRRNNLIQNAKPAARKWHKSEAGHQWHIDHIKKQIADGTLNKKMTFNCSYCGKEFVSVARNLDKNHFCSNNCKARYLRRKRSQDKSEKRVCVMCGREYMTSPWSSSKTCSHSCADRLRAVNIKKKDTVTKPLF